LRKALLRESKVYRMREDLEEKRGLTWKAFLALLFAIAVIEPAMIYYNLITNMILPLQSWIIILLWTELARSFGTPLRKQEIFILLAFQQMSLVYALYFIEPIKRMYYLTTPITYSLGIAQFAPDWWAPSPVVAEQLMKSSWVFLDSAWIYPIALRLLIVVFNVAASISMGYFCHALYVRQERLDFPQATALADTVETLANREPTQMRALMLSALAGVIYNFFSSFLPFFLGPFLLTGGASYAPVTVPFAGVIDFTDILVRRLPGFSFAINLSLLPYIVGFLIPVGVSASQALGAIVCYSVGTYVITRLGLWPAESPYSTSWTTGLLVQRSQLYFYTSIAIGLSLAAALAPILLRPRQFTQAFKSLIRRPSSEGVTDMPSLSVLLAIFFLACIGATATTYFTVPSFPLWITFLYSVGGSFLFSFLSTNAAGVTFSAPNIPYQSELIIYYSGYQQKDIWFGSIQLFTDGAGIAQSFKIAEAVDASRSEFVKTYILVVILGLVSSFVFVSLLWSVAPIPSGAYPATITAWSIDAVAWARNTEWIWSGYLFRSEWILGSFVVGFAAYVATTIFLNAPYFLIAFLSGMWSPTAGVGGLAVAGTVLPNALAVFAGSLFANKVMLRFMGQKTFNAVRGRIVVGFSVGWGFMELMRATLVLIGRSRWILPF